MSRPLSLRTRFALFFALVATCALLLFSGLMAVVLITEELEEQATGEELDPDPVWDPIRKVALAFVLVAPVSVVMGTFLGFTLAKRALAPMREANARVLAARASDLDLTLPVRGTGDEWDVLAQTLNRLLGEARGAMNRIRRFTGDAAHELRTPLTSIIGTAEVTLRRNRSASDYREALQGIEADGLRLASLVDALLTLARADGGVLAAAAATARLDAVAQDAVARCAHEAGRLGKSIELSARAAPLPIAGDGLLLGRIVDNLLENALKHGGPQVRLVVSQSADFARLEVMDDGPGIPHAFQPRLFERFSRADPVGGSWGLGLGLALSRAIAEAHGGSLSYAPGPRGATFLLELPLLRA
jgi:signal transduction histidine kinase